MFACCVLGVLSHFLHPRRCFEAVRELTFEEEGEISGMTSIEGEKIPFVDSVNPATSGARKALGMRHAAACGTGSMGCGP